MDWDPRKFFCRLGNFKKIGERSENVGATRSHVPVVGDNSKECTKLFHVLGGLHCEDCFDFLWIWFDTARSEPVSKEICFLNVPFTFGRVDDNALF